MNGSATFVIADDHAVVRRGVLQQLEDEKWLSPIGEADDGPSAVTLIREKQPDIALVDLRLPGLSGIGVVNAVKSTDTRVIVFSAYTDAMLVRRAFDSGARGFVDKASDPEIFVEAVREVQAGRRFIDPTLAVAVVQSEEPTLSVREQQILQLIADGSSNAQVAAELNVTVETVKTHVRNILAKFDADSRTEVVAMALRRSIIQ